MTLSQAYRGGFEGRAGWWLQLSYDAELVEAIKARIPATCRTWDEDGKRWWFAESQEEAVLMLVPQFAAFLQQPTLF